MMWDEVLDVVWPSKESGSLEQLLGKKTKPDELRVELAAPGALKQRLNESGWLADEVMAADLVCQGKPLSLLGMITGYALIEVARPRRAKSLPRQFVLAVTADRVVAFALSPWSEGGEGTVSVVWIKRDECGSWPRELVRLLDPSTRGISKGGTLELAGQERFPVTWEGDDDTKELIELLSRCDGP
jgi:hypothetical protein